MRAMIIRPGPGFSVQDVAFGWRDGLRELGVDVADVNYDDRLDFYASAHIDHDGEMRAAFSREASVQMAAKSVLASVYEFWPDLIIVVSGFFMPARVVDTMRAHGHTMVALLTESPYEDDRQVQYAKHFDVVMINDPTNLDAFRKVNPNTVYVPHAYNPALHHPGPAVPEMACDFAFVGTGFPSRAEFFEAVDLGGLDVLLGGSWQRLDEESPLRPLVAHRIDWCMDNTETADLYRSTRSSLNLYRREVGHNGDSYVGPATAEGWAMGPREVELAACQTFFLRDPRPEGDEMFPMLPTFTDPAEVRPLLDWWLAHDATRELVAAQAREAISTRTFASNARWLLQHTERK